MHLTSNNRQDIPVIFVFIDRAQQFSQPWLEQTDPSRHEHTASSFTSLVLRYDFQFIFYQHSFAQTHSTRKGGFLGEKERDTHRQRERRKRREGRGRRRRKVGRTSDANKSKSGWSTRGEIIALLLSSPQPPLPIPPPILTKTTD